MPNAQSTYFYTPLPQEGALRLPDFLQEECEFDEESAVVATAPEKYQLGQAAVWHHRVSRIVFPAASAPTEQPSSLDPSSTAAALLLSTPTVAPIDTPSRDPKEPVAPLIAA